MTLNKIIIFLLVNFINGNLSFFQEGFIHIFADKFKASIIIINNEQPWLEVIVWKGILFSILLLLLSCVEFLAIFYVFSLVQSYLYLLIIEFTTNLVRFNIDSYFLMIVHFENIDKLVVHSEFTAFKEFNNICIISLIVCNTDGYLVSQYANGSILTCDKRLTCFLYTDLILLHLVLGTFIKSNPFLFHFAI